MFPKLGEFQLIENILENAVPIKENGPKFRTWLNAGDDCAIFDGWLITKDLSIEGTHFRLDWSSLEQAVEKHIVSNVSDISSMGGVPRFAVLGLCLNKKWSEETRKRIVKAFSNGFSKRGISLIGGDTVSAEKGMFSTTLIGELLCDKPMLRSNAKSGQHIWVAGTLGKSAAGLWILENHPEDIEKFSNLVNYHLNPQIDESMGAKIAQIEDSGACMDISDGLSSELNHLALSSQVSFEIFKENIPIDSDVLKMSSFYGLNPLQFALDGGEEYELLFTKSIKKDIFPKEQNYLELYDIGLVKEGAGVYMISNGERKIINAQAWSHL